jgi:hypothetical protein
VHRGVVLALPRGGEVLADALGLGLVPATDGQSEDERRQADRGRDG